MAHVLHHISALLLVAALAVPSWALPAPGPRRASIDPQIATLARRAVFPLSREGGRPPVAGTTPRGAKTAAGSPVLPLLVKVSDPGVASHVAALGGRVLSSLGSILSVDLPADRVGALAGLPGVLYVQGVRPPTNRLNVSVAAIRAPAAYQETGFKGRGVVLGIIDSGIDLRHPDFLTAEGRTRVLSLWDMLDPGGVPPPGFDFGREYSAEEIDAYLASGDPIPQRDDDPAAEGHGTHVAGIAAGGGSGEGGLHGVAPEADLIVVKFDYEHPVEACRYLLEKAAELGRPVVVNNSWGTHYGPHDGSDLQARALAELVGPEKPGRALVFAAGNEGQLPLHIGASLAVGETRTTFLYTPSMQNFIEIDLWHDARDRFRVHLDYAADFGGERQSFAIESGQSEVFAISEEVAPESPFLGATVSLDASELPYPNNPDLGHVYISVDLVQTRDGTLARTPWVLRVERLSGEGTGRFDAWLPTEGGQRFDPEQGDLPGDSKRTILNEAASPSVIAVGSYVTKTSWEAYGGRWMDLSEESLAPGSPSAFSSRGPARDGRRKPDLVAPGEWIASALSQDFTAALFAWPSYVTPDGLHQILEGTSMASPHVAGVIALLLQRNPDLNIEQLRRILTRTARRSLTEIAADHQLGAGRLDALMALRDPEASGLSHGDLDADGRVTVRDVLLCLRSVLGLEPLPEQRVPIADVYPHPGPEREVGDGRVTVQDAVRLLRHVAGLEDLAWP